MNADEQQPGDAKMAYRAAWDAWQAQLAEVHAFFLEGTKLHPTAVKGLLNREARAKARYDAARRQLLGIDEE